MGYLGTKLVLFKLSSGFTFGIPCSWEILDRQCSLTGYHNRRNSSYWKMIHRNFVTPEIILLENIINGSSFTGIFLDRQFAAGKRETGKQISGI